MAREPELSIKVKVDPQIKPSELKTDIERKVKQSGEKPQIDIDPNVDGIKKKVEDKLKNIKATANITPVVDTEKLKTDIQQQINGIGDIPKVTVGVNVDDFSSELTKQLKDQLKEVNQQLSYYLKNLTSNTPKSTFQNNLQLYKTHCILYTIILLNTLQTLIQHYHIQHKSTLYHTQHHFPPIYRLPLP
mgnify:CR=1 FL=1